MSSFGERLAEERRRLGLTQEALAVIGGVRKQAQSMYENDKRNPDAAYLSAVCTAGIDITYVITAESLAKLLPPELSAEEQLLLDSYRMLSPSKRRSVLKTVISDKAVTAESTDAHIASNNRAGRSGTHTIQEPQSGYRKKADKKN